MLHTTGGNSLYLFFKKGNHNRNRRLRTADIQTTLTNLATFLSEYISDTKKKKVANGADKEMEAKNNRLKVLYLSPSISLLVR